MRIASNTPEMSQLEGYFRAFRQHIIGLEQTFESPYGTQRMLYADWTASGRAFGPIEAHLQHVILPFLANTHTESNITGATMSHIYQESKAIIKKHVNAASDDALLFCGSGMTAAVNKLQRILGLKWPEWTMGSNQRNAFTPADEALRPVVFVTHMEHHSNHLSWLETFAEVKVLPIDHKGKVDLDSFRRLLTHYNHRKNKIAAVTACSNVTGIHTPYHEIAKIVHQSHGWCFVDFACSAPYVNINMHPPEAGAHLDAVYFSGHKFLGGAGTPGILIFNQQLYQNRVPDQPGGGTVVYSNPWGVREYVNDIETREDGGTPPVLQGIKAALCIRLKETMGVENILEREKELLAIIFSRFMKMANVRVLEADIDNRLGVVSFIVEDAHYNLIVRLLSDRFGVQVRGGCSCAGTYGHYLLKVDQEGSYRIRNAISAGNLSCKPGWVRLSVHPTMTNAEIQFLMDAIEQTALFFRQWMQEYQYDPASNEFIFTGNQQNDPSKWEDWFNFGAFNETNMGPTDPFSD